MNPNKTVQFLLSIQINETTFESVLIDFLMDLYIKILKLVK